MLFETVDHFLRLKMTYRFLSPTLLKVLNNLALLVIVVINGLMVFFLDRHVAFDEFEIKFNNSFVSQLVDLLNYFHLFLLFCILYTWMLLYYKLEISKYWKVIVGGLKKSLARLKEWNEETVELSSLIQKSFLELSFKDKKRVLTFKAGLEGHKNTLPTLEYAAILIDALYRNAEFKFIQFLIFINLLLIFHKSLFILYCIPLFSIIVS